MQMECSPRDLDFGRAEGRRVVAAFDGGAVSSDAGGLLLGAADRAIGLIERLAASFSDARRRSSVEREVATLLGQRVFGLALGYEDLLDHDRLRHDPVMAILAGTLEGRRANLRLLKIGALVRISCRRMKLATASAFPCQAKYALAHLGLTSACHRFVLPTLLSR